MPVECLPAIAANTFSMHTITSSKLLAKLKLNYATAVAAVLCEREKGGGGGQGRGWQAGQTLRYIVEHFIKLCRQLTPKCHVARGEGGSKGEGVKATREESWEVGSSGKCA